MNEMSSLQVLHEIPSSKRTRQIGKSAQEVELTVVHLPRPLRRRLCSPQYFQAGSRQKEVVKFYPVRSQGLNQSLPMLEP